MSAIDAPQVRLMGDTSGGETDRVVERQITQAREAGMHVLLKPHIWIRGGAWRGHIDMGGPAAWRLWFASYRHFVLHYARMAQRHGVEVLAVGVELDSIAVRFEDAWRRLLQEVREVYEGRLVYCANWDSVADVGLWDAVDYIGVQFYPSLADAPGAADTILARRLARHMDVLEKLYQRTGRPILFTEVGYRSIRGAEVRPHAWPEREAREISHAAQARAWRLFFAGLAGRRWVRGVYLWKWFTDPATDEEGPGGFSPRGKPAEAVVRAAYGGCR